MQKFSEVSVGLCEEMGFQASSKLSTTNGWWAELWWKHVPDGGAATWKLHRPSCVLVEWMSCHGILPNEDVPDQKCRRLGCRRCWSRQDGAHGHNQTQRLLFWVELYSLWHSEPMKHVAKGQRDMVVSANTNDQTGSRVQNHLKSTDDLWRDTVQNAVAVINSTGDECSSQGLLVVIARCCVTARADKSSCGRRTPMFILIHKIDVKSVWNLDWLIFLWILCCMQLTADWILTSLCFIEHIIWSQKSERTSE